jgi:hypothetical protein
MKKRQSTRETEKMIQTAVWLPRDMHEKLKNEGGKRGLGEEIRRRLQNSLEDEQVRYPKTARLLSAIKHIEGNFDEPWYADYFAYAVFKAAIYVLLGDYQWVIPTAQEGPSKLQDKYSDTNADTLGKVFAHLAINEIKKQADKELAKQSDRQKG